MTGTVTASITARELPAAWLACGLLCVLACAVPAAAAEDYLSMHITPKAQQRASFAWRQHARDENPLVSLFRRAGKKSRRDSAQRLASGAVSSPEIGISDFPDAAAGKLFFTNSKGEAATCSAAFAGSSQTIITAAHCVMGVDGKWHSDFLFIPAAGANSRAHFAVECAAIPPQWGTLEGDAALAHDYAFLKTAAPTDAGYLALSHDLPPRQVQLVGYADNHHDGRRLINQRVAVRQGADGQLYYENNSFGRGASGTPWIAGGTVYSVSSHFQKRRDDVMVGPRFTEQTLALSRHVQRGCRTL
jgi:hypothetical protein